MSMKDRIDALPCECVTVDHKHWIDMRKHKVGGSDVAAIMGLSPFKGQTPYKVWAEKTGLADPEDISGEPNVEWGSRLEKAIAKKFSDNHPSFFVWTGTPLYVDTFVNPERPWAMATVDGLVRDAGNGDEHLAILEIKTAHFHSAKYWGESGSGASGVPVYYLTQVYHYMSVTGLHKAYVAVLIDGCDYREYEIDFDPTEVRAVVDAVDGFWKENVEAKVAPEVTITDASTFTQTHEATEGFERGDLGDLEKVEEYRALKAKATAYKEAADEAAFFLKQRIGDNGGLMFDEGQLTWARRMRKKIDTKAMVKDDPVLCRAYRDLQDKFTTLELRDYGLRWKDAK